MESSYCPITHIDVEIAALLNDISKLKASLLRVEELLNLANDLPDLKKD
jgi:hypothetical protein